MHVIFRRHQLVKLNLRMACNSPKALLTIRILFIVTGLFVNFKLPITCFSIIRDIIILAIFVQWKAAQHLFEVSIVKAFSKCV